MTLQPFLSRSFRPLPRPETEAWSAELQDADVGPVRLTGRLMRRSSERALIVLHGLGGSVESGYMALALSAAEAAGISCLLLNCRGADRSGADFYHSGLTADIEAALRSPQLSQMRTIDLFGYSIGGHIALRYACSPTDDRVRRVAAVGAPLDLRAAADDFDAPGFNVYRSHVLDSLKEIYTAAYQRRPQGMSPDKARQIGKIRDWDQHVIAPRFGFESADHYYETQSTGPRLAQLELDTIYVGASYDPMVNASAVQPYLGHERMTAVWEQGAGHLGFGADFDLGFPGPRGLEPQVLSWLSR